MDELSLILSMVDSRTPRTAPLLLQVDKYKSQLPLQLPKTFTRGEACISYYKKAGICLSFCLSVTEKFVDLSPSAETGLRRA